MHRNQEFIYFIKEREKAKISLQNKELYLTNLIIYGYHFPNINKWDDPSSKIFLERVNKSELPRLECLLASIVAPDEYRELPFNRLDLLRVVRRGKLKPIKNLKISKYCSFSNVLKAIAELIIIDNFSLNKVSKIKGLGKQVLNEYVNNIRKIEGIYQNTIFATLEIRSGFRLVSGKTYQNVLS